MRTIFAIALCLLANTLFGQTLTVEPFDAILAKAVRVEQLPETVAVMLTDKQPGTKTGAFLTVQSAAKWATPLLDGVNITPTSKPKEWILFAPAGKYRVLLAEFDPETGPRFTYHDLKIGPTRPDDPIVPEPGDYTQLTKASKANADRLNDPPTRAALGAAYTAALAASEGKEYDDVRVSVTTARFAVLNARQGASRTVDWASWLKAVDIELAKVVSVGDAVKYAQAVRAIIEGLK